MEHPNDKSAIERQFTLIDQALDKKGLGLRFPRELEEQFERETGPVRVRWYVRMSLLSLALFDSLIPDYS